MLVQPSKQEENVVSWERRAELLTNKSHPQNHRQACMQTRTASPSSLTLKTEKGSCKFPFPLGVQRPPGGLSTWSPSFLQLPMAGWWGQLSEHLELRARLLPGTWGNGAGYSELTAQDNNTHTCATLTHKLLCPAANIWQNQEQSWEQNHTVRSYAFSRSHKSPSSSHHVQHLNNNWLFTVYVIFIIQASFLHLLRELQNKTQFVPWLA